MAQSSVKKQKNRRYRNAKISEYRLRRVVDCFAKNMTVKATADATKLSRQSVDDIFHRLRERMFHHGLVRFDFKDNAEPHPVRYVVNQTHRGAPERHHDFHAAELIHRALTAQNLKGFEELSAANPAHVKKAIRLHLTRPGGYRRYAVIEQQTLKPGETEPLRIPFDPLDFEETSTLLINDRKPDPAEAFFRYLWGLLLRHPL